MTPAEYSNISPWFYEARQSRRASKWASGLRGAPLSKAAAALPPSDSRIHANQRRTLGEDAFVLRVVGADRRVAGDDMEREFTMEEGKAGDEVVLDSPDMKFGDKAIRRGFIRKVYMILSVQVRNKSVKISWEFYFLGIVKHS